MALIGVWIVLVLVDDAHGSGPWLWAALAAGGAATAPAVARLWLRRRRYGG